jgi:hypothetical protein
MRHSESSSFLSSVGSVAISIVKHIPGRGVFWGVIGFIIGLVAVGLSFVIGIFIMERGAMLLGYMLVIPFVIILLGAALFGMHGLHRGAARAVLELEKKFELVRYVVDRVVLSLEKRLGNQLKNVPIEQVDKQIQATINEYLHSDDLREGKGLAAWVIRRGKRAITKKLDKYLLGAYREEQKDNSMGGISLEKISTRVSGELSEGLAKFVMSPLNKQLKILLIVYFAVGVGWWYLLFLLLSLIGK